MDHRTFIVNHSYMSCPVKKTEMGRMCSTYGRERRGAYRVLMGKPEGRRPLGTFKRGWAYAIKVDLR